MSDNELLINLIDEIDLIMHGKQYRFKNNNETWYSRESCKDLTNEETFEELKTELLQLDNHCESLLERISELEKALENAIVPKFKIGQEVWLIVGTSDCRMVKSDFVWRIEIHDSGFDYILEHFIGCPAEYQLFATKEEAEQRLKELKGEDE